MLIAKSNGIPPLIQLVSKGGPEAQESAARALWHLASSNESQVAIAESGGITPLVGMLSAQDVRSQEIATVAISRLARGNPKVSITIADSGGIVPLVRLIRQGSDAAQLQAAAALAEVGLVSKNRDAIASAGGIPPLVAMLSSQTPGSAETAARTLAHLASDVDSPDADDGEQANAPSSSNAPGPAAGAPSTEPPEGSPADAPAGALRGDLAGLANAANAALEKSKAEVGTSDEYKQVAESGVSGGSMRRSLIKEAGGIRKLIQLLDPNNPNSPEDREKKEGKGLWNQLKAVVAMVDDALTTGGDVGQQKIIDVGVQTAAAAALSDLAKGDEDMQDAIIADGGVTPLLALVRSGSPEAQEHAARAIYHIATSPENQDVIVENGSIPELVVLIRDGSTAAQEVGAAVISELARGGVRALEKEKAGEKPPAAADADGAEGAGAPAADDADTPPAATGGGGLSVEGEEGAEDSEGTGRLGEIAAAGGILPLVTLLSSGSAKGKEHAAQALWYLSVDPLNQAAIAKAGGIAPLVQLLDDGTEIATFHAAEALKRLADSSSENQAQIAKKLVGLLGGTSPMAHTRAANALWELAANNEASPTVIVNAGAISPLVTLLSSGASEAKDAAKAALQILALNNPSNQLAIATGLVALLGAGSAEAQEHVTHLLLTLASDATNRVAISKAGAIPRLISQISAGAGVQSSIKAQELAAAVLSKLSGDSDSNVSQIASASGIKPLIRLLSSPSGQAQAHAAAVLADLTRSSTQNQNDVAHEGGIEPLVKLLSTGWSPEAKAEAAGALWSLSSGDDDTKAAVAEAGAIPPLVALLAEIGSPRLKAAGALGSLADGSLAYQAAIANANGIVPLVRMLGDGVGFREGDSAAEAAARQRRDSMAEAAATAAASVAPAPATDEAAGSGVQVDSNAPASAPASASTLPAGVGAVELHSAQALAKLARGHADNQKAIADAGAIAPLVLLLQGDCTELTRRTEEASRVAAAALAEGKKFTKNPAAAAAADAASKAAAEAAAVAIEALRVAEGAREEAAGALWALTAGSADNQQIIAKAGGIAPLVNLLAIGSARAQEQTAGALSSLGFENDENEALICQLLVKLLSSAEKSESTKAARAIARLARAHSSNQAAIARAGGTKILVSLVTVEDGGAKKLLGSKASDPSTVEMLRETASALWEMAANHPTNQLAIAAEGGIPPLIALLSHSPEIHRDAAGALWSLAANATNQAAIAEAGGIAPLVALLSNVHNKAAQDTAAGALCVLSGLPENRDAIAKAGGIPTLVALFGAGSADAAAQAAPALEALAEGSSSNQKAIAYELVELLAGKKWSGFLSVAAKANAQEHATRLLRDLAVDPTKRGAIADAGAVPQLVKQLRDGTEAGQGMAAGALSQIALQSTEHRSGVTQELVVLLGSKEEKVRRRASAALRDTAAAGGSDGREMALIAFAGGIMPLFNLLRDGSVEAQEYALWSLSLATEVTQKVAVAQAGCVEPLITGLVSGKLSSSAQEHAAAVLLALAGLAVPVQPPPPAVAPNSDPPPPEPPMSGAALIVRAGGIAPLVSLLRSGSGGAKRCAAPALAQLARTDKSTQSAIAKAGAVSALIEWLPPADSPADVAANALGDDNTGHSPQERSRSPTIEHRASSMDHKAGGGGGPPEMAARALCDLARGNVEMQSAIADEGALAPLVAMLATQLHAEGQKWAAAAIAALTESHVPNQTLVQQAGGIPPLVDLLGAARLGVREHAVMALRELARGNADIQLAIGTAGGIEPLVAMIKLREESPTEAVTCAIESLTHECTDNQQAFAAAGAIPPLVTILGMGRESEATRSKSLAALLSISHPPTPDGRDAVIGALVSALGTAGKVGQLKVTEALAALVLRSSAERHAVEAAGAITPLVALLTDGTAKAGPIHEMAATVLAELGRSAAGRRAAIRAGGVAPLVAMLSAPKVATRARAASVLARLAANADAGAKISLEGIPPLITMLQEVTASEAIARASPSKSFSAPPSPAPNGTGTDDRALVAAEARRHAAATLAHLVASTEAAKATVTNGGVAPLITMLVWPKPTVAAMAAAAAATKRTAPAPTAPSAAAPGPEADALAHGQEAAAAVLAELCTAEGERGAVRAHALTMIKDSGGIHALVALLLAASGSTALARRHAACAINGLAASGEYAPTLVAAGAVPPLIAALSTSREAQSFAVSALCHLARTGGAASRRAIHQAGGTDQLFTLAHAEAPSVRTVAADALNLLGFVPSAAVAYAGAPPTQQAAVVEDGGFPVATGSAPLSVATTRKIRKTTQKPKDAEGDAEAVGAPAAAPPIAVVAPKTRPAAIGDVSVKGGQKSPRAGQVSDRSSPTKSAKAKTTRPKAFAMGALASIAEGPSASQRVK